MATAQTTLPLNIPAWKRDLVLMRRSKSNLSENELGNFVSISHPSRHQQMRSCSVQGGIQLVSLRKMNQSSVLSEWRNEGKAKFSNDIYDKSRILNSAMKAPSAMHQKLRIKDSPKHSWTEEDEELEYGPGIVSRLKNRYMTIAMRESKGRPSLRRYSSLEDLLDDEDPDWQERGRTVQKSRPAPGGSPLRREAMKRTRSMDSLALRRTDSNKKLPKSESASGIGQENLHALGTKNIIIIETTGSSKLHNGVKSPMETVPEQSYQTKSVKARHEIPVPDRVKHVKQIFEPTYTRNVRGTAMKVAARKNGIKPQIPGNKPVIKAKPIFFKKNSHEEEFKPSLKVIINPSPKNSLSAKPAHPIKKIGVLSPLIGTGLTPITSSVTSPSGNNFKKVDSFAISNICSQSQHQAIDIIPKMSMDTRPHSPVMPLPPSPILSPRILTSSKEGQRVHQENNKNSERSKPFQEVQYRNERVCITSPSVTKKSQFSPSKLHLVGGVNHSSPLPVSPTVEKNMIAIGLSERTPVHVESVKLSPVESKNSVYSTSLAHVAKAPAFISVKSTKSKDNKRHQQENTSLVFNFSKRADTPDYIENDGIDFSKRQFPNRDAGYVIMPGYDGKTDSSTDDFDDDYTDTSRVLGGYDPSHYKVMLFEGDGIIINGRSNLQRQPRTKKLDTSFDLMSTKIYEYPSESSVMEDFNNSNSSSVGLASYTPSKFPPTDSFELGVSRTIHPPTPPKETVEPVSDYLRPADESETVIWSAESAPDMLF